MESLWPRVEVLLREAGHDIEKPTRYINHEWGCTLKPEAPYRFVMTYPDTYELGQANQAVRILCNCVNAVDGMAAERAYLPAPDMIARMRESGLPAFSVESCAAVCDFQAVGITLPHELAATNVLEFLDLAGIPVRADRRAEDERRAAAEGHPYRYPLIMGGGPCVFNAEPFAPFFDVLMLGEGEEALPELLRIDRSMREQGASREEILHRMAQVPGTYVPALYDVVDEAEAQRRGSWLVPRAADVPAVVEKRIWEGFATSDAYEPTVVPYAELVHDRLNIEVLRGCARGCRFCQAGMMYRPVRERSADNIVAAAVRGIEETGYDEVSLTSLSTTDHSQIEDILRRLNRIFEGRGISVSIPSQRLDAFGVGMAELVAGGGKKGGLTFAPEAGTQRLRDVINKQVTEDDLFNAVTAAFDAGWRRCKLYFMIGLPTETDADVRGIGELLERTLAAAREAVEPDQRGAVKVSASIGLFVPKAATPFQWDGQISPDEAARRIAVLRQSVHSRAIDISWHEPDVSLVEAMMSRGGRRIADVVETAWRHGARFDAWREHFSLQAWKDACAECGVDFDHVAQASYPTDYVMPWAHLSSGVTTRFLQRERERAEKGITTPDCTFGTCSACGICPHYGTDNQVQEARS
jgi:radical SAM family uncharacterized protein